MRLFKRRWLPGPSPVVRLVPGDQRILIEEGFPSVVLNLYDVAGEVLHWVRRISFSWLEPFALAPDGERIFVPSTSSNAIAELDLADLTTEVGEYATRSPVRTVGVSPDGRLIAVGTGDLGPRVVMFEDGSPHPVGEFTLRQGVTIAAIRFSADGHRLFVVATQPLPGSPPVLYDLGVTDEGGFR